MLMREGVYIPVFRQHNIDNKAMLLLKEEHLKEMGIPIGPRLKLMHKIECLQKDLMDTEEAT